MPFSPLSACLEFSAKVRINKIRTAVLSYSGVSFLDEEDFEGTLVLEKLAEIGKVEAFFEAIDSDDFDKAKSLMKKANLDSETIAMVMKKMADADGEY